jgi:hypothetical protein
MEGNVVTRSNIGDKVYIRILSLPPSDIRILFKFQHRQFPIYVCFAMTINKSQGQPLKQVGIYLLRPVFSDGQLFCSNIKGYFKKWSENLLIDEDDVCIDSTSNVVFKKYFRNV